MEGRGGGLLGLAGGRTLRPLSVLYGLGVCVWDCAQIGALRTDEKFEVRAGG